MLAWDSVPQAFAPLAAIMPARAYEPHRIAFYLFILVSEFRALWTLGNPSPHLCLSCSAPLVGAAT
jgi:hypothetical protein